MKSHIGHVILGTSVKYVSVKGNSRLGQSGRVNEMSKMAIFGRRAIVWIEQTGAPWLMYTVQVRS